MEDLKSENGLKRGLTQRHLTMIGLGGSIGTGLFVALGYNFAAISSAESEAKRRVPLPATSGGHIPRFVETRRCKKNFYSRNFSTDAL
jgi:hypothetical protein